MEKPTLYQVCLAQRLYDRQDRKILSIWYFLGVVQNGYQSIAEEDQFWARDLALQIQEKNVR